MTDSFFGAAWTDVDEWRDTPVRHRYVHGGFAGTDTRFSFYFPPPDQWQGRLLQTLEGGNGGHEHTAQSGVGTMGGIAFAAASGAYLVESNQGHIGSDLSIMFSEPTVHAYRASAQSARYSHELAAEMYGHGAAPRVRLRREWRLGARHPLPRELPRRLAGRGAVHHRPRVVVVARVLGAGARGASARAEDRVGDRRGRARWQRRPVRRPHRRRSVTRSPRCTAPGSRAAPSRRSARRATRARSRRTSPRSESFDPTYIDDFWSVPGYAGADGELADEPDRGQDDRHAGW